MAWTWDSYPAGSAGWTEASAPERREAMVRFLTNIDRMLFVATAALIVSVFFLLAG